MSFLPDNLRDMSGKCEKYVQIGKQKLTNYTRYVKFESIENVTENEVDSSIKI